MNPTAIYSKSGKGVQEAAGKTSILSRPDRAVLSAIDGRVTLADVAQKVGKPFDQTFQGLITKLDKDGFIREVSPGSSAPAGAPAKAGAAARPAAGKPAPAEPASDLDFSSLGGPSRSPSPPPRAAPPQPKAPPPPKPAAPPPPPREQESSLFKARKEAEDKADAAREKARKEAEDKVRAETETKLRAEAEAKAKADAEARLAAEAEAKIKAAREAAAKVAAEAKAKAEAEAKRAREEAEQARKEAEERERRAREEAERVKKEAEERERKAKEEAERARKQLEEERRKLEEERKRREKEEAERKAREEEERAERRRREEEEEKEREAARRRKREEEEEREAAEREARRKAREEEEAREAAEREARRKAREEEEAAEEAREAEERAAKKAKKKAPPIIEDEEEAVEEKPKPAVTPAKAGAKVEAKPAAGGGGFADSLMADLDSFNTREEEDAKAKAEEERKAKEEREQRAREEAERREREEAERQAREAKEREKEEKERAKREEKERLKREEEEEKARIKEEAEKREREAEERRRKAKEEEALARRSQSTATADLQDEKRRAKMLAAGRRRDADDYRKKSGWGKPVAITLFLILVAALGAAHVMPIGVTDYQNAASEALGRPVRIGSARLWLVTGVQIRFENVTAGDAKIGRVVAHPTIASLTEPKKEFNLVELEKVTLPQEALDEVLFASTRSDTFSVARVTVRELEMPGTLAFPKGLQAELLLGPDGKVRLATVRGPEGLVAKLEPKGTNIDFDFTANTFTLPIAPEITFSSFGMKGSATAGGMQVKEWDGQALNGTLSGAARVRWAGNNWNVDGVITARGVTAAVFAPALLSEGRAEGTGKFSMSGSEPAKLASTGHLEGNFTVHKGVLGSFDLSRAIQTGGRQAQGRTQFSEMTGQGSYDRGAVQLRNVTIGAGALNAGASADIAQNGALNGRIVADVRTASNTLRATLNLGGTVKEPQVRN